MPLISELLTEAASRVNPWKLECRLCSLVDLTLVGEQEVDGKTAQENDRVLNIGQTDEKQNGPWIVKRDAWVRPVDYNDPQSARAGSTFIVYDGDENAGVYRLTGPASGDIIPDQTVTTWAKIGGFADAPGTPPDGSVATPQLATNAVTTVKINDSAVTGAKIAATTITFDKLEQSLVLAGLLRKVRFATTTNDSLSGLAARDGVTPVAGNRALVKDHATGASRGVYVAASGAWTRATDFDSSQEVKPSTLIMVEEGTANGGKCFRVSNTGTVTVGTDAITFAEFGGAGGGGGGGDNITDGTAGFQAAGGNLATTGTVGSTNFGGGSFTVGVDTDVQLTAVENASLRGQTGTEIGQLDSGSSTRIKGDGLSIESSSGEIGIGTNGSATAIHIGSEDVTGPVDIGGDTFEAFGTTKSTIRAANARSEHDASSGSQRIKHYGTDGNVACTDLYEDAACSRTVVGTYTVAAGGTCTIGGVGVTKLKPTANVVCSIESASGNSYWSAENSYVAGFTVGNMVFTAAGNVNFDNGGVYGLRGPGPLTIKTSGNVDRFILRWEADTAVNTATTTTLALFTPTERPSTYECVVKAYDASGAVRIWSVVVDAVLAGGIAVLSASPPTLAAATRTIGSPVAGTLTIDTSTTTVRVRYVSTDTTPLTIVVTVEEKK